MHISTKQLVASRGHVGSNPTPGALNFDLDEDFGVLEVADILKYGFY
jgi:hypothetical protein